MAGRRVIPPGSVAAVSLLATGDAATDRVTKQAEQAIDDLQEQVRRLKAALAALTVVVSTGGGTTTASPFYDTVIDMTGSPISFGAAYDNWNVGTLGVVTLVKVITDGTPSGTNTRSIRGLVGGSDGKVVTMLNMSPNLGGRAAFQHEDAAASAANRFHNSSGVSAPGSSNSCTSYYYDGTSLLWRQIWTAG